MTKTQLIALFSDNHLVTGADFQNLIDSLKATQSAVSDPSASGTSNTFIATISQDSEGKISATKKTVNLSGYQTTAGMSAYQTVLGMSAYQTVSGMSAYQKVADMAEYQENDKQRVVSITVPSGGSVNVAHKKGHYPTVRILDSVGVEVPRETVYTVIHNSVNDLTIMFNSNYGGNFTYVLD